MYCTNCGNKLGDNDLFCCQCGNKIVRIQNKNITKKDFKTIKFPIGEYSIQFSESENYELLLRSTFEHNALVSAYYFGSYCAYEISDFDSMYDKSIKEFKRLMSLNINKAIDFLIYMNIDYIGEDYIDKRIPHYFDSTKYWEKYYLGLEEVQNFVEKTKSFQEMRKSQRSPWRGGGFGIKGAIKGSLEASILNCGSNTLSSIGDLFYNSIDKKDLEKIKEKIVFNKSDYLSKLQCILYYSICAIGDVILEIMIELKLTEKNNWWTVDQVKAKIKNTFRQYDLDKIDEETVINAILETYQKNPNQVYSFDNLAKLYDEIEYNLIPFNFYTGVFLRYCKKSMNSKNLHSNGDDQYSSRFFSQYKDQLLKNLSDGEEISKVLLSSDVISASMDYYQKICLQLKPFKQDLFTAYSYIDTIANSSDVIKDKQTKEFVEVIDTFLCFGWLGQYSIECIIVLNKNLQEAFNEEITYLRKRLENYTPSDYDELLKKGGTSCYTVAIESLLKEYPKIIPSFEL